MKSGFGAAKPLAGQKGYKMNESDILDKEAREMEIRLRNLQDRMLQQKVEDDNIPRVGGARWKSAREDKGTIRSYAKDVQEKTRKSAKSGKQNINLLTGKPMFSKTSPLDASAASLSNNNTSVKIDYMNNISASQGQSEENHQHENSGSGDEACVYGYQQTAVSDWSVDDVSDWLEHELKYPQYASAFVDNEMNGAVLMDISLEDLDYLNITKLAHRKMILKSVEALRVNPNPKNQGPKKLQNLPKVPPKSSLSAMDNAIGTESVDPQPNHTVHWSHLQPLSNNEVTNEAMPPNAADGGVNSYSKGGPEDTLDEEAEQAAFREAVMAWRASGTKNTVGGVNVDAGTSSSGSIATPGAISAGVSNIISQSQSTTSADGGWSDPFANPQYDDAANAYLYSDAPDQEQERERAAHTAIVKTSANSTDSNGITVIATKGGTQILHQPMTDEEEAKERAEFKKAVMQWRVDNGKATKEDLAELKLAEKGVVGEAVGTGTEMVKNDIAARLSKQLDSQYQANAKLLDKQRKLAEDKLAQASQELAQMRKMKEDAAKRTPMDDYCSDDEDYVSVSKNVHSDSSPMAKSEEVSDSPHGANGGVKAHSKYHLSLGGVGSSKSNTNSPSKLAYPATTPRIDLISTSRRGDDEAAEWGSEAESKFENVPYFVEEVSDSEDEEH